MRSKPIKLIFLVDSEGKNIQWLTQHFDNESYSCAALGINSSKKNITVSWRRIILYYKYINLSIRAIVKSKEKAVIVSWNYVIGAFVAFFCNIFGIKRTILSLNMISHEKGLFNKLVRKVIYNTAFKYPNFYITVNSAELIGKYSTEFKIRENHFFVLPDPIMDYYETASYFEGNGSVFCGGEAMRDWNTLFKAALLLPKVPFIAIARKKNFNATLSTPSNVTLHFDKDLDFFYSRLKESSIVAMPLSTTAPAGLIVMIRAAMLSKPIIITSTSSTRNYIENKLNGILVEMGNDISLANEISLLISDSTLREKLCNRMSEEIKKFSLENYLIKLKSIISQINRK